MGNYIGWGLIGAMVLGGLTPAYGAVVQRTSVTRPPTSRAASAVNRTLPAAAETEPEIPSEPVVVIENKTEKFEESTTYGTNATSGDDAARAALFQRQMDAITAAEAKANNTATTQRRASAGNACNAALTKCMAEKCGTDYSKCAGDGDTDWGMKMDACYRATDACTANEFTRLSVEIKADRDLNATLANYQTTVDCGNNYNSCLVSECAPETASTDTTFRKCWGKAAGDAAIAKCTQKYRDCIRTDNGLNARASEVFGTLRANAESQVRADEKRLMAMRDDMEQACKNMGALFDQRTLMCVYTVNLFANNEEHPYSSKKLFAGGSFNCTQDWFGIDITTFKENAYRETETQEAVMAGTMGAGFGLASGMVASGQISRAIDTKKAENAVEKAKEDYNKTYGDGTSSSKTSANGGGSGKKDSSTKDKKTKDEKKKEKENPEDIVCAEGDKVCEEKKDKALLNAAQKEADKANRRDALENKGIIGATGETAKQLTRKTGDAFKGAAQSVKKAFVGNGKDNTKQTAKGEEAAKRAAEANQKLKDLKEAQGKTPTNNDGAKSSEPSGGSQGSNGDQQ